jgi:hypothetical protein
VAARQALVVLLARVTVAVAATAPSPSLHSCPCDRR